MRAVEYDRYGGPEELTVRTVQEPEPRAGEVLVRVHGTSVNPADSKIRSGGLKPMSGRRFPKRTGLDFAGEVTALGAGVTDLTVGQRVWGFLGDISGKQGAAAEYVTAKSRSIGEAPREIDLTLAAALPSVGVTALRALRRVLRIKSGDEVLIVGASGGVGSAAIQLRVMMARSLRADLVALTRYVDQGVLRPIVTSIHRLEGIGEAHRLVDIGHAQGKRVIDIQAGE